MVFKWLRSKACKLAHGDKSLLPDGVFDAGEFLVKYMDLDSGAVYYVGIRVSAVVERCSRCNTARRVTMTPGNETTAMDELEAAEWVRRRDYGV